MKMRAYNKNVKKEKNENYLKRHWFRFSSKPTDEKVILL